MVIFKGEKGERRTALELCFTSWRFLLHPMRLSYQLLYDCIHSFFVEL